MRDGLPLQSRHSEERGVYPRPKSWLGQRYPLFVVWLLPPNAGWLIFVCSLLFFVWLLPPNAGWFASPKSSLRGTRSLPSPKVMAWSAFSFVCGLWLFLFVVYCFLFGCSRLMRDGLPLQSRHSEEQGVSLRPTSRLVSVFFCLVAPTLCDCCVCVLVLKYMIC